MSRDGILAKLRATCRCDRSGDTVRTAAIYRRLEVPHRHAVPQRGVGEKDRLMERFTTTLAEHSAAVVHVGAAADVPGAIVSYLTAIQKPLGVRCGDDECFAGMPWEKSPGLRCVHGPAQAGDETALSHAVAGVAETGTLVLVSGPGNPTSLAFLPETHIVAVGEDTIVGCFEDAFDIVRSHYGCRRLPRAVNLITGPSRTGDIGGRIVTGAHGPRRLGVIIYGVGGTLPAHGEG